MDAMSGGLVALIVVGTLVGVLAIFAGIVLIGWDMGRRGRDRALWTLAGLLAFFQANLALRLDSGKSGANALIGAASPLVFFFVAWSFVRRRPH